jgi:hypothetical protein
VNIPGISFATTVWAAAVESRRHASSRSLHTDSGSEPLQPA